MSPHDEMTHAGAVFQVNAVAGILLGLAKIDFRDNDPALILEWLGYRLDEAATVLQKAGVES